MLAALNLAYQLAERGGPTPPAGAAPRQGGAPGSKVDVEALLQRVDAALGDDGQLAVTSGTAHGGGYRV